MWHHRLGHTSLPCLHGMHSRLLVSGLPMSQPPLPPSPAPPCLPCVEGWQRAAPHSSLFPLTTAPLQTLHMDVWGPACVIGQGCERYFLLLVDDYTRYTMVFPLWSKGEVPDVLIPWIRAVRLQLRERFREDLPVLHLHSDRGGEFSSDLLRKFCRGEGILQSFMLPASSQQNGIAERRIGLVMEVARSSMIHVAAPHFLWPFAFRYAAHELNPWPRVSLPETLPTLRWTGKVGDASVFQVWGSRAFVRDTSAAFPLMRVAGSFTTPPRTVSSPLRTSRLKSRFPFTTHSPGLCLSRFVDSGAARGAVSGGAASGGAASGGAKSEGAESGRAVPRGTGATSLGGARVTAGAGGTGGARADGPRDARTRGTGAAGAGDTGAYGTGAGGAGPGGTGPGGAGAGGTVAGGPGAGGTGAGDPGAGGAAGGGVGADGTSAVGTVQRRPFFVPTPPSSLLPPDSPASRPALLVRAVRTGRCVPRPRPCPVPGTHVMALRPSSVPLRVPLLSPYSSSLPGALDPESGLARAANPTVPRLLAIIVTDSSFESTVASALVAELVDFSAASRLNYATSLVAESESDCPPSVGGECTLGTHVLEDKQENFECLAGAVPHLLAMLLAPEGDPDAPDIPTPCFYAEAITGPYSSQWQTPMDAKMTSWKSTDTYVDAVPVSGANIVDGMWIFRTFSPTPKMTTLRVLQHVAAQRDYELHSLDFCTAFLEGSLHEDIWLRRPPGFTGTTLVALGLAPSTADPSLFLRTDTSLPPFYVLLYVNDLVFATADTEALTLVKSELQKRHTCTDLGELRSNLGLQITRDRARRTITLTQSHMVHQVLQRFRFRYSSPQSTPLPTGHSLSAQPSDESVEPSGQYPELVGCLIAKVSGSNPSVFTSGILVRRGVRGPLGCPPSPLAPSYASAAAVDILGTEEVGAAFPPRAREARVVEVAVGVVVVEAVEAKVAVGVMLEVGAAVAAVLAALGLVVAVVAAVGVVAAAMVAVGVELFRGELELLRSSVDIFALDYDAILAAIYALNVSAESDYYLCVPPDLGIDAASLGASESALPGTAPAEALHIFTLDSGASRCFFRDSTTLTPLLAPVLVRLVDPSGGPVLARSSTVLLCPADVMVTTTTPGGQRVSICTCTRTGRHLATFTRRPGWSLYTLTTERAQGRQRAAPHSSSFPPTTAPLQTLHMDVWGPARVSGQGRERYFLLVVDDYTRYTMVFPLRRMGEVRDVLIPWIRAVRLQLRERFCEDLPLLRLHSDRGGEFSSNLMREFCRGESILQSFTLSASPQQNVVVGHRIGLVMEVARTSMIHAAAPHFLWPFGVRYAAHQLNLWPRVSLPETSPTLHWTGKVGDASMFQDLTFDDSVPFYRLFPYRTAPLTPPPLFLAPGPPPVDPLPPQGPSPSGVSQVDPLSLAEPFEDTVDSSAAGGGASRGAACGGAEPAGAESGGAELASAEPRGAEPEGAEPGGAQIEGAEPGGAESKGAESGGAEPRGIASGAARAGGSAAGGTGAGGAGATSPGGAGVTAGAEGIGGAGAAGPGGACTRGTGVAGAGGLGGAGVGDPGAGGTGAGGDGAGGMGAGDPGAGGASAGGAGGGGAGAGDLGAGGVGAGGAGVGGTGAGDPRAGGTGAGDPRAGGTGAGGARAGAGAGGARVLELETLGAGGVSAGGAGAGSTGARGTVQRRPFFVPPPPSSLPPPSLVLHQVLNSPQPAPSPYAEQTDSLTERHEPESCRASPVRAVCTGRRVPRQHPPPVPGTHIMALRPSFVPLQVPLQVPLPSPHAFSLADGPNPLSELVRAASPTVSRLLATVVADPFIESVAFSLVAELFDFAATCRLDYAASLVAESESECPPSVGGECALGTDVLEDRQEEFECLAAAVPHLVAMLLAREGDPDAPNIPTPRSYAEAITGPYSSHWQTAMDAEMASWKSTGTYVDAAPPLGANIVDGMWIFRVKRSPGCPPVFKARYVARGFSQRQGVDFFQTFSPTPKMTNLRILLHFAAQRDYELHSLDFSIAFLQGSLHEEIWLRRPPGFTGLTTLVALGFAPSSADPSLFLRTDTSLPPFYVLLYDDDLVFATADSEALTLVTSELRKRHTCTDLVLQRFGFRYSSPQSTPLPTGHSLSAPPSDESVELSGPYPELVGCLMYLMTCSRPDLAYPLSIMARYVAPGRHRPKHWEAAKRVLRYLCSTSGMGLVLGGRGPVVLTGHADASWVDDLATQRSSSCEAEIYAGAMAARELRWLTYLLTDLGERPRSPPILYVDNNAMIALCYEHRLEHRMKHIALRYFLARELQQRDQLRLAYVATWANTADIFTKAL
ncbi:unnamed protein product [Closterium sp. NIES-53]